MLLERLDEDGQLRQLSVVLDFEHAALVLRDLPAPGSTPDCLRTVNSLAEALAALHREAGRLGPSLSASPAKPAGRAAAALLASPAKPPLPEAHGADALRLAVGLVRECGPSALREGLAILSAAAGSPQLSAEAVGLGALEALVAAAATVLPSPSMGLAELQPAITVAVTSLLDAAPPSACCAARLVSVLAAALRQGCASPLLLCRLLAALLERPDVRAEGMRQGLAGPIADMYARLSPAAAAAAVSLDAGPAGLDEQPPGSCGTAGETVLQRQHPFGSPLQGAAGHHAAAARGRRSRVASSAAAPSNAMSDSGSDCSPAVSLSASPAKLSIGFQVSLMQGLWCCTGLSPHRVACNGVQQHSGWPLCSPRRALPCARPLRCRAAASRCRVWRCPPPTRRPARPPG